MSGRWSAAAVVIGVVLGCSGAGTPAPSTVELVEQVPAPASPAQAAPASPERPGSSAKRGASKVKIGGRCDPSVTWSACAGDTLVFCSQGVYDNPQVCGTHADEVAACVERPGAADGSYQASATCKCREGATFCGDGGQFSTCVDGVWSGHHFCADCSEYSPETHSGKARCLGELVPVGEKTGSVFGG
jgi:hypothetical protein